MPRHPAFAEEAKPEDIPPHELQAWLFSPVISSGVPLSEVKTWSLEDMLRYRLNIRWRAWREEEALGDSKKQ